ncbi:MAG: pilus assembly protein [Propionibacteriaceae bacterium]|nr:pilus assembly protein [Propionibacteriaceae bacterium]
MRTDERGAAAVELALIVPILVLLLGVVVGGARVWLARTTVEQLAAGAARAGSLARTPGEAVAAAESLVRTHSSTDGLRCLELGVDVDARGLANPPGVPAQVEVRVSCAVGLTDLIVPGWPGQLTVSASGLSVVDTYRGRQR